MFTLIFLRFFLHYWHAFFKILLLFASSAFIINIYNNFSIFLTYLHYMCITTLTTKIHVYFICYTVHSYPPPSPSPCPVLNQVQPYTVTVSTRQGEAMHTFIQTYGRENIQY